MFIYIVLYETTNVYKTWNANIEKFILKKKIKSYTDQVDFIPCQIFPYKSNFLTET